MSKELLDELLLGRRGYSSEVPEELRQKLGAVLNVLAGMDAKRADDVLEAALYAVKTMSAFPRIDNAPSAHNLTDAEFAQTLSGQSVDGLARAPLESAPAQAPRKHPEGTLLTPIQAQEFAEKLGLSLTRDGLLSNTNQP